MRITRFSWDGRDAPGLADELRALQPPLAEVAPAVTEIIEAVEEGGDAAVRRFEQRFGGAAPKTLRVAPEELANAPDRVPAELAGAIRRMIANVERAAEPQLGPDPAPAGATIPAQGDAGVSLAYSDVPVAAAGAYAPGGGGSYPSTAVMCCVPARVAGVERIAVSSPPRPDGGMDDLVLAACAMAGATEVYGMGGAQAIAALALGTESVRSVDLIVGPGNRYVQEAKRQLVGRVGIDGVAGPSELMVVADEDADRGHLALDLGAQAEHGDDGLLVACSTDPAVLSGIEAGVEELSKRRETIGDAPLALVAVPSTAAAIELADALAPEHLELVTADAEELAPTVRYAGCVFVGPASATAFGDYAAGSNHVLPTGGAGRFTGPLGPDVFRRRLAIVALGDAGARDLAPTVATLARAEGFPVHAESAEARAKGS